MPFHVILATAPTEDLGNCWVSLKVLSGDRWYQQASLTFGPPAHIGGTVFDIAGSHFGVLKQSPLMNFAAATDEIDSPAIPIDLDASIHAGEQKVDFSLKNLYSNDTLHLVALSRQIFLGNVFHRRKPGLIEQVLHAQCVAKCADGKSAQGCVTCVAGGITVKICC